MKKEILITKKSRQLMIESHGITIIRTNPDAADFDMNRLINQIQKHIIKTHKVEKEKDVEIKTRIKELNMKNKKINN